jgi:putative ABC transport system permease protein
MQGLWLDVKSALRQLRLAPGTSAAAIATLAVGIGTTTAVFSFLAAVMSSAAPVDDMERRVALWSHNRSEAETKNAVSTGDFLEWRRRATLLDSVMATRRRSANVGGIDRPVRASVNEVTSNYFEFFRRRAAMGRVFTATDGEPGAPPMVVLSYDFWRNTLAARADIVGATLRIDGQPVAVVGVLPRLPAVDGIYVPIDLTAAAADHVTRNLFVFGRMRDGVSIEQVRAEMSAIGEQLEHEFPRSNQGWAVNTQPLQDEFIGPDARLAFAILAGTVLSVLLIGCVNIANLLLARGLSRRGELAVRLALGAGGWRVARQLLVECGAIALAGAILSVLVSRWTLQLFVSSFPIDSPWVDADGLNLRALGFTAAGAVLATLMSGVAPIVAARRTDLVAGLQTIGRSGLRASRRLTSGLVAAEIGLAVILLIVSGLLMRTLAAIERLEPGFEVANVLTASITRPQSSSADASAQFFEQALARIRALPGVTTAAAASRVPFAGSRFNPNRGLEIEGRAPAQSGEGTWAVDYTITPQFFETLRVPLVEGRTFNDGDGASAAKVAIVSAAMARRFWPNRSPVGARLRQGDEPEGEWCSVVGVVGDIRNDDADQPPIPYLYVPLAQRPARTMTIVVRTAGDPAGMAAALRGAVVELDPDQPLYDVRTMEQVLDADLGGSRVLIQVFAAFAAIALGLAGIGVWGVAAQAVGQRTREIGVRIALGATARQVVGLMAFQGLMPMAIGLVIGLAAGLGVAQIMRGVLFQVSATDPLTIAGAVATLIAVGIVATTGPSLRAARLDPVTALREQ